MPPSLTRMTIPMASITQANKAKSGDTRLTPTNSHPKNKKKANPKTNHDRFGSSSSKPTAAARRTRERVNSFQKNAKANIAPTYTKKFTPRITTGSQNAGGCTRAKVAASNTGYPGLQQPFAAVTQS